MIDAKVFYMKIFHALEERRRQVGLTDPIEIKNQVAARLQNYRLLNKITQKEMAKKLGVTRHQIIRWESRNTKPGKKHLERMRILELL